MGEQVPRGFAVATAARHLRREDPQLARWMRRIGAIAPDPRWNQRFDLVDALARAILHQQLSGKAAATIVGRVEALCGSRVLRAKSLAPLADAEIRACGVSGNKLLALRDLAAHASDGRLPRAKDLDGMDNEAIIAALTSVRGIGRWTVEMLLMFRLGRADVLPVDDLGIRKGLQRLRELQAMPTAKESQPLAAAWAPWRTLGSLYLWRIADFAD